MSEDLLARLKKPLPVCPYDRRSPLYYDDMPVCPVCRSTENGPDLCRSADTRIMDEAAAALEANQQVIDGLKRPFCVLFLDGRNEYGSHVLPSYPRSFEAIFDDMEDQAELILAQAENIGFAVGDHVWAEFDWIDPQIGDEGRVELSGYWEFKRINAELSRAALTPPTQDEVK